MRDCIGIHQLELDCIVGTRPNERLKPQRVSIDLRLRQSLSQPGRSGRIAHTTDYDQVARQVAALLRFRRYHLIEMAAEELSALLLGAHRSVQEVEVCIEKPRALEGRARAASVTVARRCESFDFARRQTSFGAVERLLETREALLELFRVDAGGCCSLPPLAPVLVWPLTGELSLHRRVLPQDAPTEILDSPETRVLMSPRGASFLLVTRRACVGS